MEKELVIDISAAGSVKIEANNFKGVGCAKATESIELALNGGTVSSKKKKPEYYAGGGANLNNKQCF